MKTTILNFFQVKAEFKSVKFGLFYRTFLHYILRKYYFRPILSYFPAIRPVLSYHLLCSKFRIDLVNENNRREVDLSVKNFTNISVTSIAALLGLKLEDRKATIVRSDDNRSHMLTSQIHLFLLLHFYANSNDGKAELVSIDELSQKTSRDVKTIYRSLNLLMDCGYIHYQSANEPGYISVEILNIQDMYKRRGEGGHGYITFNTDMLTSILKLKKMNVLRTVLVSFIEIISQTASSATKILPHIQITLDKFRQCFPKSTRPVEIREACDNLGDFGAFFSRMAPDLKNSIFIRFKPEYETKSIKQELRLQAKSRIFSEIDAIEAAIGTTNASIEMDKVIHVSDISALLKHNIDLFKYKDPFHPDDKLPLLDINSGVKNDCVTIAQDYGIDTVIRALHIYYTEYLLSGSFKVDKAKSVGGLIRKIVQGLCSLPPNFLSAAEN